MIDDEITEEQALEVGIACRLALLKFVSRPLIDGYSDLRAGRAAYAKSIAIDRLKTLADPTEEEQSAAVRLYTALTGESQCYPSLREVLTQFVACRRAPVPALNLAEDALRAELDRQTEKDPLASAFYAAMIAVVRAFDAAQKAGEK